MKKESAAHNAPRYNQAKSLVSKPRFARRRHKSKKDYQRKPKHVEKLFLFVLFVVMAGMGFAVGGWAAKPENPVFVLDGNRLMSQFEVGGREYRATTDAAAICTAWGQMNRGNRI